MREWDTLPNLIFIAEPNKTTHRKRGSSPLTSQMFYRRVSFLSHTNSKPYDHASLFNSKFREDGFAYGDLVAV